MPPLGIDDLNPPEVLAALRGRGKRNKYGVDISEAGKAARTYGDKYFASEVELRYYTGVLLLRQRAGQIRDLLVHPRYEIIPSMLTAGGKHFRAVTFNPDFSYQEMGEGGWQWVVDDVKGKDPTDAFKVRMKMFLYQRPDCRFRLVRWDRRANDWTFEVV